MLLDRSSRLLPFPVVPAHSRFVFLILKSGSSPRLEEWGTIVASWFETAQARLLTMREIYRHFADFAGDCHLSPSAI
jgi:hypothetical protein